MTEYTYTQHIHIHTNTHTHTPKHLTSLCFSFQYLIVSLIPVFEPCKQSPFLYLLFFPHYSMSCLLYLIFLPSLPNPNFNLNLEYTLTDQGQFNGIYVPGSILLTKILDRSQGSSLLSGHIQFESWTRKKAECQRNDAFKLW